jgi:acylphosphatase
MSNMKTFSIIISGKVQGVFYRQSTKEKAVQLGIKGKVMNLDDGNVQVIATGDEEKLEQLIAWCRQGPPRAVIENIDVKEVPLEAFEGFRVSGQ